MSSHCVKSLHSERSEFLDNKCDSDTCCLCVVWQKCTFLGSKEYFQFYLIMPSCVLKYTDTKCKQNKLVSTSMKWQFVCSQTKLDSTAWAKRVLECEKFGGTILTSDTDNTGACVAPVTLCKIKLQMMRNTPTPGFVNSWVMCRGGRQTVSPSNKSEWHRIT